MRSNISMSAHRSGLAAFVLLVASGMALGQQQVNLTAGPTTITLPDGSTVPMWGYTCGIAVAGSSAICAALNPAAPAATTTTPAGWSPVVITVPSGQNLQINLTNSLSFTAGAGTNTVPTSLVIVGQLGGGLGSRTATCGGSATSGATCTSSPDHTNAQPLTWPVAGDPPGASLTGVGTPPAQGVRVQSLSTEVPAGTTTSLTWTAPLPGTYLIESGTHPSIQGPMGLYGMVVVTCAPTDTTSGCTTGTAYPGVAYNSEVPLLLSEIDPVQNTAVNTAVTTSGFSETKVWSGQPGQCGNPSSPVGVVNTCYPPAVNYSPLYYLINGVAFDRTHASTSLFASAPGTAATPITGTVLVRLANAGLRMHVPSLVGTLTGGNPAASVPAVSGFSLIAEDGNPLPGVAHVQSEVFMPAGKTYDLMINVPAAPVAPATATALPIYDRQLSLSGNATARDAGMLAYIGINGAGLPSAPAFTAAVARPDTYNSVLPCTAAPCTPVTVSDPGRGVIANDTNVTGVQVLAAPSGGTLALNANGTFTYTPNVGTTSDSYTYCANGSVSGSPAACSSGISATVTLGAAPIEAGSGITMNPSMYVATVGPLAGPPVKPAVLSIKPPGILAVDRDGAGYPLTVNAPSVTASAGLTVAVDANGGFNASVTTAGTYTFTYKAQNSQGTVSASTATVTLIFPTASNLSVTVLDGKDVLAAKTNPSITPAVISDYRWIIEEDRTFYNDPNCTTNPPPAGCPTAAAGIVPTFGTNFHTSYMPLVAAGCTGPLSCEGGQKVFDPTSGTHINAVCDVGNGACRADPSGATATGATPLLPGQVHLEPTKRYYFSILPGDAANPFENANFSADCTNGVASATAPGSCGHGMGGAPVAPTCTTTGTVTTCAFSPVTVLTQPDPYPPAKLSVFVFEDDFPLNGEHDGGGGIDILGTLEPGLGGFNIILFDDAGGTGDATGQMTYDMFNQPLVNSLAGTIDPASGNDACPVSVNSRAGVNDPTQTGITGTIVTCPKFESDGRTLSPLAGQAVIANLMVGRYGVVATPGADRIARGEEWLQTNTLDGQKAHDSFLRIGEPSFFQEFGPAGYHVAIGFANPTIINSRLAGVCGGGDGFVTGTNCTNTVTGLVTTLRMSRTPDERLYSSGTNDSFAFTQCYVSLGDPDGEDFAFTKCNADGTFSMAGLPNGDWRITIFDQWNDMLVDGLSTPVRLGSAAACPGTGSSPPSTCDMGEIAMNQWQANIYTKSFIDRNGNGLQDAGEPGLTLVPTNIRFRDGSYSNFNNTDLAGSAGFNEIFPLFSWYVIESDSTRFKNTGTHVVYDSGGPADDGPGCGGTGNSPCGGGNHTISAHYANSYEAVPVPGNLHVPGAVYCSDADCTGQSIASGPSSATSTPNSTSRIDPPWVVSEGWQGYSGQNSFLEFGKKPFAVGENGGIRGEVIYASTRPFDDPALLIHTSWTPNVPGVTINLYQVGTAADGSQSLRLVDTTRTSSWDDWAQGFRSDGVPNMNCPGQGRDTGTNADLFFFTLFNQPMYLDFYNSRHGGAAPTALPNNGQFKCYDGMHNWNQLQPAPYDGMYQFPSVTGINPTTGKPTGTNCTICVPNPDSTDPYRVGLPMLPAGKYVVEMVVPPGYELVKEEDKNILIGDNYIAPVTQEFPGLGGAIYILPDQAAVGATYNANSAQNPTTAFGRNSSLPSHEGDTGSVESFWPCVGRARIVPDYISLFPRSTEVSPFAGAMRNLCDRKLVTLDDQTSALAKFWIFTSTHVAAHYTGIITDDFTSEFDPFSPQFGEKFSPANLPVAIKDWSGSEISRVYTDHWGSYDGLTYSTWEVNPPNPTGYGPTMMVTCMNDPGSGAVPDPLYNPAYSQFCYEIPFMPGQTQYMDTPVTPTSAFAGAGYNNPDCDYPDATPAISEVDGGGGTSTTGPIGPWVSAAGQTLHIYALGAVQVNNYGYSGPSAATAPFNAKTVTRKYSFGSCTTVSTTGTGPCSVALVGADGVAHSLTGVTWGDLVITGTVPSGVPACPVQQQALYAPGASSARCGELIITTGAGQRSTDTVTVTIGGKAPTHVSSIQSIQRAINAARPGDLIIIDPKTRATSTLPAVPAVHEELLLMWKPVRLQGVGAASSVINANTHPAGKLDPWRAQVNCLFGLALNGQPYNPASGGTTLLKVNPYDPTGAQSCPATGWSDFSGLPNSPQVDRLPLEGIVGWDTSVNGNLAELLQEPSLMGAYEGAAITVLGKGVQFPAGVEIFGTDPIDAGGIATESQMPLGTVLLTSADCLRNGANPYPSNFLCNPSRIDGLSLTDSSQGGGGVFIHAWGHNLEIANNRIYNNAGTQSGGINIGQGESPDALLSGNNGDPVGFDQTPWTCVPGAVVGGVPQVSPPGFAAGVELPNCYDLNVNVHHNAITKNSSYGDELFSGTPAGAGGVSFCTGSDNYLFNYNWVCGNLSTGDGGGLAQLGYSQNGHIEHNAFLFNQSTNPTSPTNGGGIIIMGTPPDGLNSAGLECGSVTDVDCAPGLSDGAGPGLVINANLIMGNAAESGSGGGLRFQAVNGTEVSRFPGTPGNWYSVNVTNNIIANNVAGWDGAGVSLEDALAVNFVNNTVISNDTTASAGVLFNTLGAPVASSQSPPTSTMASLTSSLPQPAGLVALQNSPQLTASLAALTVPVICPPGHYAGTTASNGTCRTVSYPELYNDVFWQNRAFYIGVGSLGTGTQNQQHVVALYNAFTTTQAPTQSTTDATTANGSGVIISGGTGACTTPNAAPNYWDIGVRGDTGPSNHSSGVTLAPTYSVLTDAGDYPGLNNTLGNPTVLIQYCNGSRVPPEFKSLGYQVPPGISDATVPNPIFNLTPAATVDEGNNWINILWGPLSLVNTSNGTANGTTLGNYGPAAGSSVINYIPSSAPTYAPAPSLDFYGNQRKTNGAVDAGAVEFQGGTGVAIASVTGGPLQFGSVLVGTTSASQNLTLHNTGTALLTGIALSFTGPYARITTGGFPAGAPNCGTTLGAGANCTIKVVFQPTALGAAPGSLAIAASVTVSGSPVTLNGTGAAPVVSASLAPTSRNFGTVARGTFGPIQVFTLTNTGNVPLTGITQGALGGTDASEFTVIRLFSTCGPAGGGQALGQTTLGPGAMCVVTVQFRPLTSQTTGVKNATISVTDAAGTQTSTLTGTAN